MDTFLQDLRYAVRTLVKNPGFAALTVTCLALGHRRQQHHLQRRRHRRHPAAAVSRARSAGLAGDDPPGERDRRAATCRTSICRTGRHAHARFADIAAVSGRSLTLSDGDEPERFNGATVTWNMFPMLGIQPILGRQIRAEEDTPGGPRVVLLSHGVWQRRYAADPSIIGRSDHRQRQSRTPSSA